MPTFGTNSQIFNTNGTFTVPAGITSIVVECWGGGGSGGRAVGIVGGTKKAAGGGGGGGAYARSTLSVTPGATFSVNVAAAQTTSGTDGNSSWFGSASTVLAVGGKGGGNQTEESGADKLGPGGSGGWGGDCIGDVLYSGGDGSGYFPSKPPPGCLYVGWSGAGGGGAGNTQNGGDAPCPSTSAPPGTGGSVYGGNGGSGVSTGNVGNSGLTYGGGGSGGHTRDITIGQRQGGAGAQGLVIVWWTPTTPPSVTKTVCTTCNPVAVDCYFYIGSPENPAPDGYYSDGTKCYTVSGGAGYVTSVGLRIDWDVREQGSGGVRLVIKDASNVILLDQISTNAGPLNGTIYVSDSQVPYSVTVSVDSGTEAAQYRICNVTLGTQIEYNSSVTTTSTYTVSPTPLHSAVFATYGDTNTPLACPL